MGARSGVRMGASGAIYYILEISLTEISSSLKESSSARRKGNEKEDEILLSSTILNPCPWHHRH